MVHLELMHVFGGLGQVSSEFEVVRSKKVFLKKIQKMPKSNFGFFVFLFLGVRFEPGFKRIVWSGCLCAV